MARQRAQTIPPIEIKPLSPEEIDQGIRKLQRRIADVEALKGARYGDQKVYNAESSIQSAILEIFGQHSQEFRSHGYHHISHGALVMGMSEQESQRNFEAGLPRAVEMLQSLVQRLCERQEDMEVDPAARGKTTFSGMDLHPGVRAASGRLYLDGHYSDAVFAASKALINYVQEKSSRFDLDGTALMTTVFSKKSPVLVFNDLSDQTKQDEQEGMMHLFVGASLGIRNPRGHSFVKDSPERAIEYIAFLSMLANRVDEAGTI